MNDKLNRRRFLKMAAMGTCGAACHNVLNPFGGGLAYAFSGTQNPPGPVKRLIEVFLYGGACSYSLAPGHNNAWQTKYPTLYRRPDQATYIGNSEVSLHQAFAPFVQEANGGSSPRVALIYNTGHPQFFSRSHDIAQNANERVDYDSRKETGVGVGAAIAQALGHPYSLVSFGGNSDFSTGGIIPARAVGSLANGKADFWQSEWFSLTANTVRAAQGSYPTAEQTDLQESIDNMESGLSTLKSISQLPLAAQFPNTGVGRNLADITRLIKANVGAVYFVPYGGFDTHSSQATQVQNSYAALAAAWRALIINLKAIPGVSAQTAWDETVVITRTDFGRTFENNAAGTDHGHCYSQIVFGGKVAGGVYGDPLNPSQVANASQDYLGSNYVQFSAAQPTKEIVRSMGLDVPFPDYPGNKKVPIGFI